MKQPFTLEFNLGMRGTSIEKQRERAAQTQNHRQLRQQKMMAANTIANMASPSP
jgi:hypothetical protein